MAHSIQSRGAQDNASLVVLRSRGNDALNIGLSDNAKRVGSRPVDQSLEETEMSWKTPTIVEIALGAEINCYACAELK